MAVDPQTLLDDVGPASLVEMGTLVADLGPRHILEGAPFGTRVIVDVTGMRIEDERLRARMRGTGAADWGSRAAWLNKVQAVMKGRSDGATRIAYRLYELR